MLPSYCPASFLRSLEALSFASRRLSQGSLEGQHRTLRRGHGVEFAEYRRYEPGDNPKHIDWKLLARTDKVYVRTYQEEKSISVLLLLDTTASMQIDEKKWQRARNLILGLSYIASLTKERTSLYAPPEVQCAHLRGPATVHHVSEALNRIKEGEPSAFLPAFLRGVATLKAPGVCFFVSDFLFPLEEVAKLLDGMRQKNLDVFLVQVLGSMDTAPFRSFPRSHGGFVARDAETNEEYSLELHQDLEGQYSELFQQHLNEIGRLASLRGMSHLILSDQEELLSFFTRTLRTCHVFR